MSFLAERSAPDLLRLHASVPHAAGHLVLTANLIMSDYATITAFSRQDGTRLAVEVRQGDRFEAGEWSFEVVRILSIPTPEEASEGGDPSWVEVRPTRLSMPS